MTEPTRSPTLPREAAIRLLAWYDLRRRDLPWRRDTDAYRVWVSEIMLQQTRVETVLRFYEPFLERFPTVQALAAAPLDEVLAAWSGLGYYRRARQLHAAARAVDERGAFPRTAEGLRELPGIGDYTSAAVASIAFSEVVPVLDGNVERVTARLVALAENPKRAATRRRLRQVAHELLDPARPGDSNQALMELGATVCRPRSPRCDTCPLALDCRGRTEPESYPAMPKRKAPTRETMLLLLVSPGIDERSDEAKDDPAGASAESSPRLLYFRRPDDATLFAGMWELPTLDAVDDRSDAALEQQLSAHYGGTWTLGRRLGTARHGITTRSLVLDVREARRIEDKAARSTASEPPTGRFLSESELPDHGVSSMVAKALDVARQASLV